MLPLVPRESVRVGPSARTSAEAGREDRFRDRTRHRVQPTQREEVRFLFYLFVYVRMYLFIYWVKKENKHDETHSE